MNKETMTASWKMTMKSGQNDFEMWKFTTRALGMSTSDPQKTLQNSYRRHQIENIYPVFDHLLAMPPCLFTISTTQYFSFIKQRTFQFLT
jgi:hypothetical protein